MYYTKLRKTILEVNEADLNMRRIKCTLEKVSHIECKQSQF